MASKWDWVRMGVRSLLPGLVAGTRQHYFITATIVLSMLALLAWPTIVGSTVRSQRATIDPNSVVPDEFTRDMAQWSEEGGWHWVTLSYSGDNTTVGVALSQAHFVATLVRTLSADDPCPDCMVVNDNEQGPPNILGGSDNPALAPAYASLDNGERRQTLDDPTGTGRPRWAAGAWYLNYSPVTNTFFAWTWVPEGSETGIAGIEGDANGIQLGGGHAEFSAIPGLAAFGSRVPPMAPGSYVISQDFGCVPFDAGYSQPSFCPPDRPSFHHGTDYAALDGTLIYAAASGTVTFADVDPNNSSGNSVIQLLHDGSNEGYLTEYLHWKKTFVEVGDYVVAGQPIAENGSIGYSTGPHLHFGVKDIEAGAWIDPLAWLQAATINLPANANVLIANVLQWDPFIRESAERHRVPPAIIAAIMTIESSGNPGAISPAGARGLMQIMPFHLARLGVPEDLWLDPQANIEAGARYLAETIVLGGTVEQAAARYFGEGCDVLGTCTGEYVSRAMMWYAYYDAYFSGNGQDLPPIPMVDWSAPTTPGRIVTPQEPAAPPPQEPVQPPAIQSTPEQPAEQSPVESEQPVPPQEPEPTEVTPDTEPAPVEPTPVEGTEQPEMTPETDPTQTEQPEPTEVAPEGTPEQPEQIESTPEGEPEQTDQPEATPEGESEQPELPEEQQNVEGEVTPEISATPETEPTSTAEPEPTQTIQVTETPESDLGPEDVTPTPKPEPTPEETPVPTVTDTPEPTPEETLDPTLRERPEPEHKPEPTPEVTPEQTIEETAEPEPSPTPEPTLDPEQEVETTPGEDPATKEDSEEEDSDETDADAEDESDEESDEDLQAMFTVGV